MVLAIGTMTTKWFGLQAIGMNIIIGFTVCTSAANIDTIMIMTMTMMATAIN